MRNVEDAALHLNLYRIFIGKKIFYIKKKKKNSENEFNSWHSPSLKVVGDYHRRMEGLRPEERRE